MCEAEQPVREGRQGWALRRRAAGVPGGGQRGLGKWHFSCHSESTPRGRALGINHLCRQKAQLSGASAQPHSISAIVMTQSFTELQYLWPAPDFKKWDLPHGCHLYSQFTCQTQGDTFHDSMGLLWDMTVTSFRTCWGSPSFSCHLWETGEKDC